MTGPEHIGDVLARALGGIKVGSSDLTLGQVEALAMIEIAKIMGWPLGAEPWDNPEAIPDRDDPFRPLAATLTPEEFETRCRAIAEATPPTYPRAIEIYGIAADQGPSAARAAIQASVKTGEITRLQANTLSWVLALENT